MSIGQYLAKLPNFLASALWDVLVATQFGDVAWRGKADMAHRMGLEGLSSSAKVILVSSCLVGVVVVVVVVDCSIPGSHALFLPSPSFLLPCFYLHYPACCLLLFILSYSR